MTADPTSEAGIDVGQRWRDRHTGDHFVIERTYRDHPTNPSFQITHEPPAPGWVSRGRSSVTLGFIRAYCDQVELRDTPTAANGGDA